MNYAQEEDFVINTLQGVPGFLGKLVYLNSLRDENGEIRHWGLEKVYGKERVSEEFEAACTRTLNELLKIPVQELWKETMESSGEKEQSPAIFIQELQDKTLQNIPATFGEAQRLHIKQVLDVIFALAENSHS